MKKLINNCWAWVCCLGLIIVAGVAVFQFGPLFSDIYRVNRIQNDLRERSDRHELGGLMAGLLENPNMARIGEIQSESAAMPERLRALGRSTLRLEPENGQASLMLGGGFESYGYLVKREGAGSTYKIYYWNEHKKEPEYLGQFQR